MASITDAADTKRYLVKVEPGIFQVSTGLQMKQYVDLEGSGERVTKIISSPSLPTATVIGNNDSELRFLTIEQSGPDGDDALAFTGAVTVSLHHVTFVAWGKPTVTAMSMGPWDGVMRDVTARATGISGTTTVTALVKTSLGGSIVDGRLSATSGFVGTWGIDLVAGALSLSNTTVFAGGNAGETFGIQLRSGELAVRDSLVTTTGPGATGLSSAGVTQIESSDIRGGTSIVNTSGTVRVATTRLTGAVSGSLTCAFVYSDAFVDLTTDCIS